jgi:hypothetical protein
MQGTTVKNTKYIIIKYININFTTLVCAYVSIIVNINSLKRLPGEWLPLQLDSH